MKVAALEAFGINERIISIWQQYTKGRLLPVQVKAVKEFSLFQGENILVFSPTSSGKTFIGEMVAVKTAMENKQVFYLVPQKALAEEKFREFQERYQEHGIKIVISSKDRKEYDQDINKGDFRIAVVVFEKMQSLLVSNPSLITNVGLIVLDELQMISDPARGPKLELLLTKILLSEGNPQFIGLSAVLGKSRHLAQWLKAKLLEIPERPVELRRGVIYGNLFHYEEYNGKKQGQEEVADSSKARTVMDVVAGNIRHFAARGEQTIVFCSTKRSCEESAESLAKALRFPPVSEAISELEEFDDTLGKDILTNLLSNGIAYHNANLNWDQRELVERYFREGKIISLCSTSTLAMGMNLPAKNVFVSPKKWKRSHGGWTTIPITKAEYENMSGRAGRLNQTDDFGRSIMVAHKQFEADTLFNAYVHDRLEDVRPSLDKDVLSHHILNIVASGLCSTEEEIERCLLSSFTGMMIWNKDETSREEFKLRLSADIKECLDGELLICDEEGKFQVTELGKVCAAKGILVKTTVYLSRLTKGTIDKTHLINDLELLLWVNTSEDGLQVYFNLSTYESRSGEYPQAMEELVRTFSPRVQERFTKITERAALSYDQTGIVKKSLILYNWVTGTDTIDIERKFHCFSGSIYNLAGETSWLMEALAEIAKVNGWEEKEAQRVRQLSERMIYGVEAGGLEIAALRVRRLGRDRIKKLVAAGLGTVQKLIEAPLKKIGEVVSKDMAKQLQKRAFRVSAKQKAIEAESFSPAKAQTFDSDKSVQLDTHRETTSKPETNTEDNKPSRKRVKQISPEQPLAWEQVFLSGLGKLSVPELKKIYRAVSAFKHDKFQHLFDDVEAKLKKGQADQAGHLFDKFFEEYRQVTGLINQSLGASFFPDIDAQMRETALLFQEDGPTKEIKNKLIPLRRELKKTLTRIFNYLEGMQHNLNALAQAALESKRELLQGCGIGCQLELEDEENMPELFMDKDGITDALCNLLRNAGESFSPEQEEKLVTIKTCRNNHSIGLWVIDNGRGIEKERWATVFDPGHTTKGSDGLGLALCKEAVVKNGGSICIEDSSPGQGTSFKIVFEV